MGTKKSLWHSSLHAPFGLPAVSPALPHPPAIPHLQLWLHINQPLICSAHRTKRTDWQTCSGDLRPGFHQNTIWPTPYCWMYSAYIWMTDQQHCWRHYVFPPTTSSHTATTHELMWIIWWSWFSKYFPSMSAFLLFFKHGILVLALLPVWFLNLLVMHATLT